jgi:hypothetical protein
MRVWIDGDQKIGTIGYLAETISAGETSWSLHDRPVRGWRGVGRVVRRNKTRDRAQVLQLRGDECDDFLRSDGHAELVPPRRLARVDAEGAA